MSVFNSFAFLLCHTHLGPLFALRSGVFCAQNVCVRNELRNEMNIEQKSLKWNISFNPFKRRVI